MPAAQEISDRFKSHRPSFTSKINVDTGDVLSRFDRKREWKRDPTMARDHANEPRNSLVTTSFDLRLVSHRPLGQTSSDSVWNNFNWVNGCCSEFVSRETSETNFISKYFVYFEFVKVKEERLENLFAHDWLFWSDRCRDFVTRC